MNSSRRSSTSSSNINAKKTNHHGDSNSEEKRSSSSASSSVSTSSSQHFAPTNKKLLKFAKKPVHISDLKETENAELPTQLQQPVKGQPNIRMCPHFFSPSGCQLGNFCQFQHAIVSTATLAEKNRNMNKLLEQQQQIMNEEMFSDTNSNSEISRSVSRAETQRTSTYNNTTQARRTSLSSSTVTTQQPQSRQQQQQQNSSNNALPQLKVDTTTSNNNSMDPLAKMKSPFEDTQKFFQQQQQQQQQENNNNNNNVSTYRWFWRELAKDFCTSEKGLSWRPFEQQIESTLESSFVKYREEDGAPSSVNICLNKFTVDFDKMQLCNAVDGGSRRSIQRIRVEAGFFWFACEISSGKAAWKFPFDVSCVLEREYVTGNATNFGLRIGPRAAALVSLDSMTMQVLPEVAPLFSSVFDKELKKQDYHDLIDKIKEENFDAGLSKEKLRKDGGVREVAISGKKMRAYADNENDNQDNNTNKEEQSPDARDPRRRKHRRNNNRRNSPFGSPSSSSDDDSKGSSLIEDEEEEIEMIASAEDDHKNNKAKKKKTAISDESDLSGEDDDDEFDDDEVDEEKEELNKKVHLADAILKLAMTTNNLNTFLLSAKNNKKGGDKDVSSMMMKDQKITSTTPYNTRILTLKLQRQPLSITAACPSSDFFGISRLRERACFVADSGEILFSSPETGPDVFGKDELQVSVLPCIRAAILGSSNVLATANNANSLGVGGRNSSRLIARPPSSSAKTVTSNNSSSAASTSALPPCSDKCLIDENIFGSYSSSKQQQISFEDEEEEDNGGENNEENNENGNGGTPENNLSARKTSFVSSSRKKTFAAGVRDVIALRGGGASSGSKKNLLLGGRGGNASSFLLSRENSILSSNSSSNNLQMNKLTSLAATAKHLLDKRSFTMSVQHMHSACHQCMLLTNNMNYGSMSGGSNSNSNSNNKHHRSKSSSSSPYLSSDLFTSSAASSNQQQLPQHYDDCYLHEITNLASKYRGKDLQEVAMENPHVAKQLRFLSVTSQIRARLHEQFFMHVREDNDNNNVIADNAGDNNKNPFATTTTNKRSSSAPSQQQLQHHPSGDRAIAIWHSSQDYLKQFRTFIKLQQNEREKTVAAMNLNENNNIQHQPKGIIATPHPPPSLSSTVAGSTTTAPSPNTVVQSSTLSVNATTNNNNITSPSSSSQQQQQHQLPKKKKTARIVDSSDQSLLPIQLLSEGTPEWNKVLEWCAHSNVTTKNNSSNNNNNNPLSISTMSGNSGSNTNNNNNNNNQNNVSTQESESNSNNNMTRAASREYVSHRIQEETQLILQLMPRIRRVDRYDLCMRYKRCRDEIFASWVRLKDERNVALSSGEKLVFLPATPDQLASLMEANDSTAGMTASTKRIVFTSFEAALFASAVANGLLTSSDDFKKNLHKIRKQNRKRLMLVQNNNNTTTATAGDSDENSTNHSAKSSNLDGNNNDSHNHDNTKTFRSPTGKNNKTRHHRDNNNSSSIINNKNRGASDEHETATALDGTYLNAFTNKLGQTFTKKPQGIIVGLAYFGPQARAPSCNDRLFNYPSPRSEKDPLNSEFRCVMNTSAVVEGEANSFAALFLEAQFCPLYFISLSS